MKNLSPPVVDPLHVMADRTLKPRKIPIRRFKNPKRLREIYSFIEAYQKQVGFAPSMREIARKFDCDISVVKYWLNVMEAEKLLTRLPRIARGITLLPIPEEFQKYLKESHERTKIR